MSGDPLLETEGGRLVDVAMPVPLRQTFSYRVPEGIGPVGPGRRVLAPFRSKLLYGITMGACYAGDPDMLKRCRYLVSYDDRRVLAPEIAELIDWMVRYYKCPVGEAVKLAMPPGLLSEQEVLFSLTPAGVEWAEVGADARIPALLIGKKLTKKKWESLAQAAISLSDIRAWEDAGWLEMKPRGAEKETIPHETVVSLSEQGRTVNPDDLARAPKQQEALIFMRHRKAPFLALTEINKTFGPSAVNQLLKRGYITRSRIPKHELERGLMYQEPDNVHRLTMEQEEALTQINGALENGGYQAFLLFGVTGAGKTEVYLRAIQRCLELGRRALFLVPEIALTPLMHRRILDRFGERLAILHSAVGAGERAAAWAKVLAGKVDLVLGARSGIFAPLPNLGLVIVDEEHDSSYKQNDGIRYSARDLAMVRAKYADAAAVLGSATPSLETWHNQERGRIRLLTLKHRATKAKLPTVDIVDMREEFKRTRARPVISALLFERIEETLAKGHQVMILLNRRGYYSFMLCRKCGEAVMCDQCEVTLTYHRTDNHLRCHYCGQGWKVPEKCGACGAAATMMQFFGEGTQQVQEMLASRFPDITVDRLDRDRLGRKEAHQMILADFETRKSQILVGTQMIAKGHDFPNVTLVGVLNADMGLKRPDFRCAETTFQLLTQVAGRSGRGHDPGSVVVQSYNPDHYSIVFAAHHDYLGFLQKEMRYRKHMFYSPFSAMIGILITHEDDRRAADVTTWMTEQLKHFQEKADLVVLGPARAPIGRIKGAYRYQILLKSARRMDLQAVADKVVEETVKRKLLPRQAIILDIDPYQFF